MQRELVEQANEIISEIDALTELKEKFAEPQRRFGNVVNVLKEETLAEWIEANNKFLDERIERLELVLEEL